MKLLLTCILLSFLFSFCTTEKLLKTQEITNFNLSVFDSLKCCSPSTDNKSSCIIYVSNNECAECIYKFIKFNKCLTAIPKDFQCTYIIYGQDYLTFNYYMKENDIHLSPRFKLIQDSTFIFHNLMKDYLGDQIFILRKDKTIRLLSDPLKDKQTFNEFKQLL